MNPMNDGNILSDSNKLNSNNAAAAMDIMDHPNHAIEITTVHSVPNPSTATSTTTTTTTSTKSQQIEHAIRTNNIWFLRSLALSADGLINGRL